MPLVTSTSELRRSTDVVQSILVKDAQTLVFVLSAVSALKGVSSGAQTGNSSSQLYRWCVFSSTAVAVASALSTTGMRQQSSVRQRSIKGLLWAAAAASAAAAKANRNINGAAATPSFTAQTPTRQCCGCESARETHGSKTTQRAIITSPPPSQLSDSTFSSVANDSFAALRATKFFSTAATATDETSTAHTAADKQQMSDVSRLHVVRERATGTAAVTAAAAAAAAVVVLEVWLTFSCGCCALATFALTELETSSPQVRLTSCTWVPYKTVTTDGDRNQVSVSPMEVRLFLTEAATTSHIRTAQSSKVATFLSTTEAEKGEQAVQKGEVEEALLATVYQPLHDCAAPRLRLVVLCRRCCNSGNSDTKREWESCTQGCFSMDSLFGVPPAWRQHLSSKTSNTPLTPSRNDAKPAGSTAPQTSSIPIEKDGEVLSSPSSHGAHASSVRCLRWLVGTSGSTHSYPLLAVLYAAPAVSLGDPCLDTLSVCYLREDSNVNEKAASWVTGSLLRGPWSVRGLSLALPSYMFTTTVPRLPQDNAILNPSAAVNATSAPRFHVAAAKKESQNPSAYVSAAGAFRAASSARRSTPMELVGVFQRPAYQPYAASRLFRSSSALSANHSSVGGSAGSGYKAAAPADTWGEKGNEQAFAFVLYGATGEVARCAVDGYPECAHDLAHAMPEVLAVKDRTSSDGRVALASLCALFPSSSVSSGAAAAGSNFVAVVFTVFAQPARVPARISTTSGTSLTQSGAGVGAAGTWRFSVQVTQRLPLALLVPATLPSCSSLTVVSVTQLLSFYVHNSKKSTNRSAQNTQGEVMVLVSAYTSVKEGSGNGLYEGVWEAAAAASESEQGSTSNKETHTAAPCIQSGSSGGSNNNNSSADFLSVHPVSAGELTSLFLSCCPTDTTREDLLSHTSPAYLVDPRRSAMMLSCDIMPIALAWLPDAVKCSPLLPSAFPISDASSSTLVSMLDLLTLRLDVVAILRCGAIVGWSCDVSDVTANSDTKPTTASIDGRRGPVVHLGTVCCPAPTESATAFHGLPDVFLRKLLNEGATPASVFMEVVAVPSSTALKGRSSAATTTGAAAAAVDGADALLVVAVGPLVGAVSMMDGSVLHVVDVRTASESAVAAAASMETRAEVVTVTQLRSLPVKSPYAVLPSPVAGENSAVGASYAFLWTGCVQLAHTSAQPQHKSLFTPTLRSSVHVRALHCVLQLGVLPWKAVVEVAAASAASSAPNGEKNNLSRELRSSPSPSAFPSTSPTAIVTNNPLPDSSRAALLASLSSADSRPHPPSIISLEVSAAWYGVVEASSLQQTPDAFTLHHPACWVTALSNEKKARQEMKSAALVVCDAALLRSAWPNTPHTASNTVGEMAAAAAGKTGDAHDGVESSQAVPPCRLLRWLCRPEETSWTSLGRVSKSDASTAANLVRSMLGCPVRVAAEPCAFALPGLFLSADGAVQGGLRRVLYMTALPIPNGSVVGDDGHVNDGDTAAFSATLQSVVLCTVAVSEAGGKAATLSSPSALENIRSFLVCGVAASDESSSFCRGTAREVHDATQIADMRTSTENRSSFPVEKMVWHWLSLPAVSLPRTADEKTHEVPLGVTRVLRAPSATHERVESPDKPQTVRAADLCTSRDNTSAAEFYCEGVLSSAQGFSSVVCGLLVVRWGALVAALFKRSGAGADGRSATASAAAETDLPLLRWAKASLMELEEEATSRLLW